MRKLTSKQKEFSAAVIAKMRKGERPAAAVKEVYTEKVLTDAGVVKWADGVMAKPQVRREIVRILDGMNLSKQDLSLLLYRILHKPRGKDADKLRGIEMAFQAHGVFDPPEQKAGSKVADVLNIFIKNREERGLPVPENIKTAIEAVTISDEAADELVKQPIVIPTNSGTVEVNDGKRKP